MSIIGICACSIILNLVSLCWLWVIGEYAYDDAESLDWSLPKLKEGSADATASVILTFIPLIAPALAGFDTVLALFKYFVRNPVVFIILVFISAVAALIFDIFHN